MQTAYIQYPTKTVKTHIVSFFRENQLVMSLKIDRQSVAEEVAAVWRVGHNQAFVAETLKKHGCKI